MTRVSYRHRSLLEEAVRVATAIVYLLAFVLTIGPTIAKAGQFLSNGSRAPVDDYLRTNPDFLNAYEFPWLGIEVKDGEGTLKNGDPLEGIEVSSVLPAGPGAAAGLRGDRLQGLGFYTTRPIQRLSTDSAAPLATYND
jgi:S1-C subfamily serine protease